MQIFTTLPDDVLRICDDGTYEIDTDKLANLKLKNVSIPEKVSRWPSAFGTTTPMLNIIMHPTLKQLGDVFTGCIQFEENKGGRIYYTGTREQYDALITNHRKEALVDYTPYYDIVEYIDEKNFKLPEMDFQDVYDDYDEKIGEQIRFCAYGGDVTIPANFCDQNGKEHVISGIGSLSFAYNKEVKSIIIPENVDYIDVDAFRECVNLKEVIIEDSERPLTIEMGAFYGCKSLKKVHIGRISKIGRLAFACLDGAKPVIESVQDLGDEKLVSLDAFD